jgi:hypothetical protein
MGPKKTRSRAEKAAAADRALPCRGPRHLGCGAYAASGLDLSARPSKSAIRAATGSSAGVVLLPHGLLGPPVVGVLARVLVVFGRAQEDLAYTVYPSRGGKVGHVAARHDAGRPGLGARYRGRGQWCAS